jgi:uncharacterized protein (TIGR03086 family)
VTDIRDLDRRAVEGSAAAARQVIAEQLGARTPCGDWTVLELLEHMAVQHHGFAAAARGHGADASIWPPVPLGDDPVAAYLAACADVVTAFAEDGVLERSFELPEISTAITFPAAQAMSFHFVDYVVHGWDLAAAIGAPYAPDDDVLDAALEVAGRVPVGDARLAPGAAFAPVLEDQGSATLDRILLLLGRSPGWPAAR